jgi:CDP-diacylglycerol--serine O-phosphatidyltransferase
MKKLIPNAITILNLLCGCIGAVYAFNDSLILAGMYVALGVFFDFFDGLAARVLDVSSELGKQLDSLADLITSGLVPGIVMCQMLADAMGHADSILVLSDEANWSSATVLFKEVTFLGFFITAASAYRLANFNIDSRQSDRFIGVPTPANAIFIISLGIIAQIGQVTWVYDVLANPYVLILITMLSCYALNANLPLFALKFNQWIWSGNEIRYIFLVLCVALLLALELYAIPCIVVLYVLMSVVQNARER